MSAKLKNEKDWVKVEVSSDGKTIYQGCPSIPMAKEDEEVWLIRKITIRETDGQVVDIKHTMNYANKWTDRKNLNYYYV